MYSVATVGKCIVTPLCVVGISRTAFTKLFPIFFKYKGDQFTVCDIGKTTNSHISLSTLEYNIQL